MTFSTLDAHGFTVRISLDDPIPFPDWRFPPTDERLLDIGLRVYRLERTETVLALEAAAQERTAPGHVAVDEDGKVLTLPSCAAFLPGGRLEVERELDVVFSELGFFSLVTACEQHLERGVSAVLELFNADG